MQGPPDELEKVVKGLFKGAIEAAEGAAERLMTSEWQLSKREGEIFPSVEKKSAAVGVSSAPTPPTAAAAAAAGIRTDSDGLPDVIGLAGAAGTLARIEANASAALSTRGGAELEAEFTSFLAAAPPGAYRTTEQGEVVFASQAELASLVATFAYSKLQSLAAASRALARYVEDLEGELEAADDVVVRLRRECGAGEMRLGEVEAANAELRARADAASAELKAASVRSASMQARLDGAERAADAAAQRLMDAQARPDGAAAAAESMAAERAQAASRAVELEARLMEAEEAQAAEAAAREKLRRQLAGLEAQREEAASARAREQERLDELRREMRGAEAAAESKATSLRQSLDRSEQDVAALQAQLREISSARAAAAPPTPASPAAPPPTEAASGPAAPSFDEVASLLTQEIEATLQSTGLGLATGAATDADARLAAAARGRGVGGDRPPLSRMNKASLSAECTERCLDATGTVAELRARLRVERKRDALVADLIERGWSERQARTALGAAGWELETAIAKLQGGRGRGK